MTRILGRLAAIESRCTSAVQTSPPSTRKKTVNLSVTATATPAGSGRKHYGTTTRDRPTTLSTSITQPSAPVSQGSWICRECRAGFQGQLRRLSDRCRDGAANGKTMAERRWQEQNHLQKRATAAVRQARAASSLTVPDTAENNGADGGNSGGDRGNTVEEEVLWQSLESTKSKLVGEVPDPLGVSSIEAKWSQSRRASVGKRQQTTFTGRLSEEEQDSAADWAQPVGNYREIIPEALIHQDGERLLNALFEASYDLDYIRSIPPTAFSQILRLLEPNAYFGDLVSQRLGVSSVVAEAYQMLNPDLWQQYSEHIAILQCIVDARRQTKLPLSLVDIKSLLRCASQAGDGRFADSVWNIMKAESFKPDTAAWNLYLRSLLDNHYLKWDWDHSLRSTKKHLYRRVFFNQRRDKYPQYYPGYQIGRHGVKERVSRIFADMMNEGQVADEETFTLLMTAYGREGDTKGIEDVLMKAWGIDVQAVISPQGQMTEVKYHPINSPLTPSDRLLYTIAHVYGRCQNVPAAFILVLFASEKYRIKISTAAWEELASNTLVGSVNRSSKRDIRRNPMTIPMASLQNLFVAMTAAPHNTEPTSYVYNLLASSFSSRNMVDHLYDIIKRGFSIVDVSAPAARAAIDRFRQSQRLAAAGFPQPELGKTFSHARREHDAVVMRAQRERWFLRRWLRLYMSTHRDRSMRFETDYENTFLRPQQLLESVPEAYLSSTHAVALPTGTLTFRRRSLGEEWEVRKRRWIASRKAKGLVGLKQEDVSTSWFARSVKRYKVGGLEKGLQGLGTKAPMKRLGEGRMAAVE